MLPSLDSLTVPPPEPSPADWTDTGVVHLPRIIPKDLRDDYRDEWWDAHGGPGSWRDLTPGEHLNVVRRPGGWNDCTPYMRVASIRRIAAVFATALRALLGEDGGMHLNLTGWVTTTRDWHQDSYLNPAHVGDAYAAAWIALDDVHPDSGVFQYVPGSHRWPQVTRDKIGEHVDLSDPRWPILSEQVLSPLFEEEIKRREAEVVRYVPNGGDVLLWHGRLLHRGSLAHTTGAYRPGLIIHFSGVETRRDFPRAKLAAEGGYIFPIRESGPVA